MGNIVKKPELVKLLAKKTGFYKQNMRDVAEALAEIIFETLESATFEQDSEIHLAHGLVIGGRRVPEREAKDPRNGDRIMSPEKVIPYATFKPSLRKKLYVQKKKSKNKKG